MGYELAREARKRNYKVTLISGPTGIRPPRGIKFVRIESALELYKEVRSELTKSDILVMASAVSDFRPFYFSEKKIKSKRPLTLRLLKNPDILKSISRKMRKKKIIVGFSLETTHLLKNALKKLSQKRLDLIVANKADKRNVPFGTGEKTVYLLDRFGRKKRLKKARKSEIARAILDRVEELCYTPN